MEQIPNFPKNLAYNLKKLQGSIIKQKLRISSDKSSYVPNEILRINFPIGRMIDLRSVVLQARAKATGTGGIHFPRLGVNSLIEQLQITANGRILQNTQMYNFIYNLIADIDGYSSPEQAPKRITELFDPSIISTTLYTSGINTAPTYANTIADATNDDDYYLSVNNWLGFMGGSCSAIDTNNLGQIQLSITLAPSSCLFYGTTGTTAAPTDASYTLSEVDLLVDTLTFTNSTYYELVKSQLEGGGLNVAYYDYIATTGNSFTKADGYNLNFSTQINANSLDQVIATYRPTTYNTISRLLLGDSSTTTNFTTLISSATNLSAKNHGAFNNTNYFRRDGSSFKSSAWYINSQPFTQSKNIHEVINNTLQALNYANIDVGSGSFHGGIVSPHSYGSHYFADILSLENLSGDNNWWVSGMSGNGGTIQIQYQAIFGGAGDTGTSGLTAFYSGSVVYPVIIARVSKVLNIKMGRLLDVME